MGGIVKDEDPKAQDDIPMWVKPMIMPMKAQVSAIAVEYSLHEGRFWLPRLRLAEADAQVSFMHVPVKMEQSFKYASVNGPDTLPAINLRDFNPSLPPDSLDADPATRLARLGARRAPRARKASRDSVRRGLKSPTPPSLAPCMQPRQRSRVGHAAL